jgi:hypothetical protein
MVNKREFLAFENVRLSGVTNMWDSRIVCELADLDKETYLDIVENYGEYLRKYIKEVK